MKIPSRIYRMWAATIAFMLFSQASVQALENAPEVSPATIATAQRSGGSAASGDSRDADVYPAVAYAGGRYLAVWLTARNADSSSDNFDIFGIFLNQAGQPISTEFRISDSNTAARSSFVSVVSYGRDFVVVWTSRASLCQILMQRVADSSARTDRLLVASARNAHSPSLAYNPNRNRFVLAYVDGDDYLPPTLFGASTATCGNNAASTSQIRAVEFALNGDAPAVLSTQPISDASSGTFRPSIAYSGGRNAYLIAWEDRRNAGGQPYRFDVFAQQMNSNFSKIASNIALDSGYEYANLDSSATWTPRPAIVGGTNEFLAVWFRHQGSGSSAVWNAMGRLVPATGAPAAPFKIAEMPFAEAHAGQAPTGYLSGIHLPFAKDYLIGMSSHLETFAGYLSSALVQRVSEGGALLKMDGTSQDSLGVGYSIDYALDDQIGIALALNPYSADQTSDGMVVYSRHALQSHSRNYDVWNARVQYQVSVRKVFIPSVSR